MADSSLSQSGLIYPSLLPDEGLLYAATVSVTAGGLVVQQERQQRVILNNAEERLAFPMYSPAGQIIYQRGFPNSKGIWAVPFDGMQVTGDPFPVDPVGSYPTVSSNGTLVYRTVDEIISFPPGRLIWVDRQGRVESVGDSRAGLAFPALSPDGKRVAFTATYQRNQDIWIYDLQRDTPERLTFDSHPEYFPVWSPNGRWVAFQSYRTSNSDIYIRVSDGSGAGQMLVGGPGADRPPSFYIKANHPIRQSPNHPIRQSSNHHFYRSSL
jgi:Tol biopolymer transport system component